MDNHIQIEALPQKKFWHKHTSYFSSVWSVSLSIGGVYGFINALYAIYATIRMGNFWGFVFAVLFNGVAILFWALIGGGILFVILVIITIIPYLLIRGFFK